MEELSSSALAPIIGALKPESPRNEPLICDRETFSKIYQLEKRRQKRDFSLSYLTHIRIRSDDDRLIDYNKLDQLMLHTLKEHIRSSDTVCQWGKKHFAVLLYEIDDGANVELVKQRIKNFFYTDCEETEEVELNFWHNPVKE